MKRIIVIAGPTASGKTSLAVSLAKRLNAPIISADSRQFYKELSIGTAKPTPEEMSGVTHYFVNSHSVVSPLTSGQFEKEALKKIQELFEIHQYIIVVGGSGMFIDALIYGTDQIPHQPKVRLFWNREFEKKGIQFLQSKLKEVDPEYYEQVDLNNPARIIRALEIHEITQQTYSSLRKTKNKEPRFQTDYFIINHPREVLYNFINKRVDKMIENGLINEAKNNLHFRDLQPLNTVGYKEIFSYFDKEISKERAIELIKQNTRRYAKRQLTWFRKNKNAHWITATTDEEMINSIFSTLKLNH